jgi:type 1 fimbria pilin
MPIPKVRVNRIIVKPAFAKKCLPKNKLCGLHDLIVYKIDFNCKGDTVMRYLITLILLSLSFILAAQVGMNVNTPEGSVNMSITGMPTGPQPCAPTNQSTIDLIVDKLEKLEKEVHIKLTKLDKKKADKIMEEVYELLGTLECSTPCEPAPAAASASASASSSSSSSSSSSGTANVNINISGMEGQNQPPANPHHNENEHPQEHNNPPHHQEQATPKPMPDADFNTLQSKIKSESFSDNKLRVLGTAAKNFNFSCNQIISLVGILTFSEDKLEALRLTYPKVTDPQNNYKILDAFTFSADKEIADSIINN